MVNKRQGKRKRNSSNFRIVTDYHQIEEELDVLGQKKLWSELSPKNTYLFVEKILTFADIPTYGKYCYDEKIKKKKDAFSDQSIKQRAESNYLFYLTKSEIAAYELKNKKKKVFFCETKQSNISMPEAFYDFLGLDGGSRANKGTSLNSGIYSTFIVNSCIKDCFEEKITNETFAKLGRTALAKSIDIDTSNVFSRVELHIAVHGIGIKSDEFFHALRGNMFAKDKLCTLVERTADGRYRLFFMVYRNPKFYVLNNRLMPSFLLASYAIEEEDEKKVESRRGQARWRNMLAEYALTLSVEDTSKVVCPFTRIEVQYPAEATLLRASHIKAYAKCKNADDTINLEEAYDRENGFLVTANVDALFDKYLITVKPDGTVVTSKSVSQSLVFDKLGIVKKIDPKYISEKKKQYLKVHYETFLDRESKMKE